jgi:hypothetical protein
MARILAVLVVAGLVVAITAVRLRSSFVAAPSEPSVAELSGVGSSADRAPQRERRLNEHEARQLAFAELEEAALRAIDNPWKEYWRGANPALAYAQRLQSAYAALRQELERRFGAGARQMSEFARAFRPLDTELGFLASEEQIEIGARRLRAQAVAVAVADSDAAPADLAASRPSRAAIDLEFLTPAAALEVRLRTSALAEQLRRSRVELSEEEFRAAFALLDSAEAGDLKAHVVARRSLRRLLGDERFLRLVAQRDPQYQAVARVGRERGLDEASIAGAYEIVASTQESLLDLAAGGGAFVDAETIAARERERLTALVGEDVAAAMLTARSELQLALARPGKSTRAER